MTLSRINRWTALLCATAALCATPTSNAADLGVVGPVHPIGEPDMLDAIEQSLKQMEARGDLARIQRDGIERASRSIATPAPVAGLHKATEARTWRFDPSVSFDEPVLNADGQVVVPAGTLANPLAVVSMPAAWLLFDGRDAQQVALAERRLAESAKAGRAIKPILVGGSPLELGKRWQRPVYFDQFGRITRRLGLTAVPALVSQDGLQLVVQEIVTQ
ncbi:MAG: type-F conjugative transfer system protein TraW [Rubrivivax sp.]